MIYIENIFVCLAIPMFLSMLFTKASSRRFTFFVITGMFMCLLSAYVNSFFMGLYGTDEVTAVVEITPVCEELMKLLPLLFCFVVAGSEADHITPAAIAMAVGFATFENVCYLTANGTENLMFLLMRGLSAGALHILCGIVTGFGLVYVFKRRWMTVTGTVGLLGVCISLHALYNLMITAEGYWKFFGYFMPAALLFVMAVLMYFYSNKERFLGKH